VKRGKNDAADAEAICEAVTRPTMRFVGVKTVEQQSIMMLHRVRLILMRQRTQLSNALRSHLAEFGIVSPIGREGLDRLLTIVADTDDGRVPAEARASLAMLAVQLEGVKAQILENDRRIIAEMKFYSVCGELLLAPEIQFRRIDFLAQKLLGKRRPIVGWMRLVAYEGDTPLIVVPGQTGDQRACSVACPDDDKFLHC
jgi:transposase